MNNNYDLEKINLAKEVYERILEIYTEKYSHDDNPSALAFYTTGSCWYMAKMLKYLFPYSQIIEIGDADHFYVEVNTEPINFIYPGDQRIREVTPEYIGFTDDIFYYDKGEKTHKYRDKMSLDIINTILADPKFKDRLGDIRGDVCFYGLEEIEMDSKKDTHHM